MTDTPPYQDPDRPTDERVADLLERMTIEEKAGQLVGTTPYLFEHDPDDVVELVREGRIGHVSPIGLDHADEATPRATAAFVDRLQRAAVEDARLGIPVLVPTDAVHGHARVEATTVFPHSIGLAATRSPGLVRRTAAATARELRATGAQQNYGPTADVCRDPRWGRTLETFGESPHLVAELAAAEVRGYQDGDGAGAGAGGRGTADAGFGAADARAGAGASDAADAVAATVKHFPAYGEPVRGEDMSPVECSPATLRRVFLPPFEAAVEAGSAGVMPCYNAVGPEPAHGSARLLTGLLRDELGFEGVVASDWNGVGQLHEDHHLAADLEGAVELATGAGLDVASIGGLAHADALRSLVEAGTIDEGRLDESVRRVLAAKVRLGLFEDPSVDVEAAGERVYTAEHRELAREAATRSLTLLENDGLLPLSRDADVLLAGPSADDVVHQCGGWTVPTREAGTTILEGVEAAGGGSVAHVPGAGIDEPGDVEAAAGAAADADVAVAVCGEGAYYHEFVPTDRAPEPAAFPNRAALSLPEPQRELLEALAGTGTPTALVLVAGRPLSIPRAAEHLDAVVHAFYPGSEAGPAVADVLYGERDPAGRLPISVPRSTGHLPARFDRRPHPAFMDEGAHLPSYDPLYAFGDGLSYADFEHADLSLSTTEVPRDGTLEAALTVENVGDRRGRETVDAFVRDEVSSVVTPLARHCGFGSVDLAPGERADVTVEVGPGDLELVRPGGERVVEPGAFELTVGERSARFEVGGYSSR